MAASMGSIYGLMERGIGRVPLFPSGVAVAMESLRPRPGRIWMKSFALAVCGGLPESVPRATKLNVPTCVGVPSRYPVAELRERPGGNWPDEMLQVYGGVPPVAGTC